MCQHNQHILWNRKFSLNRFFLFIWGQGIEIFYFKKISKISWHCPFKRTFRVNTVVWFLFWWRSHFRYSLHTVHSAHTCRRKSVSRNWTLVVSSSGREVHCTLYTVHCTRAMRQLRLVAFQASWGEMFRTQSKTVHTAFSNFSIILIILNCKNY